MLRDIKNLADVYLITGNLVSNEADFLQRAKAKIESGIQLLQLRIKGISEQLYADIAIEVAKMCQQHGCNLILNHSLENLPDTQFQGIHLTSKLLMHYKHIPQRIRDQYWLSAACHDLIELERAEALCLDFAILTPIQKSNYAPTARYIGWKKAIELRENTSIPLFAAGGMDVDDVSYVKEQGFHGIAALGALWDR